MFDVDKFMERAKKYAAKSPGVASVFKKRPMYDTKSADKDVSKLMYFYICWTFRVCPNQKK